MAQSITITGRVRLVVKDKHGKVRHEQKLKNLVTTVGLTQAAKRIGGVTANAITYIAIGDDATAPAVGQTALVGTELERVLATAAVSGDTLSLTATLGSTLSETKTIREIGTFDAASTGNMFSRVTPISFEMDVGDTLDVTWELQLS